jgi:hypothetical protein
MGVWIPTGALGRVRSSKTPTLETTMQLVADRPEAPTAIHTADSDEVAQGFRFDGAHHSEMMSPISRSLAGG